jgi:hypothetical protein
MSLSSYNDLKAAVANWTKRADLSAYLDDLVTLAEIRILREVRTKDLEANFSAVMVDGTIAVPADFLGWRNAYIDAPGQPPLNTASPDQIRQKYDRGINAGMPSMVAQEGGNFIFWPTPAGDYTVKGVYYARPSALSTSVHPFFTNNPDLYLFATLAETAPFLKDDKRVELWEAKYVQRREDVLQQDKKIRFAGRLAWTVSP